MLLGELFNDWHEPIKLIVVNRVVLRLIGTIPVMIFDEDEMVALALDLVALKMLDCPLEL